MYMNVLLQFICNNLRPHLYDNMSKYKLLKRQLYKDIIYKCSQITGPEHIIQSIQLYRFFYLFIQLFQVTLNEWGMSQSKKILLLIVQEARIYLFSFFNHFIHAPLQASLTHHLLIILFLLAFQGIHYHLFLILSWIQFCTTSL